MTRLLAVAVAVLLTILQPTPPLQAGEAFRVTFDHQIRYYQPDPANTSQSIPCATTPPGPSCSADTTGYALRVDGTVLQTLPVSANTTGSVIFSVQAGLAAGAHSVIVEAVNNGLSTAAPVVPLTIDPQPISAPGAQGAPTVHRAPVLPPAALTVATVTPWAVAASGPSVTTAAVNLSAGDLVLVLAVTDGGSPAPTLNITAGSVPFTSVIASGAVNDGGFRIWRAQTTSALSGFAATVTTTAPGFPHAAQLVIAKGADLTQPIGATWSGAGTTNAWTATTYTATIPGSIGVAVAVDWHALGIATSTDLASPGHLDTKISWLSVVKLAPSATLTPVTFVFDGAGSAAPQWRGGAIEIRPR